MIKNYPAWANGSFCTIGDLSVSILDLGLIHCDATYEVISSNNRKIFMLDQHLDRFDESCRYWRLRPIISRDQTKQIILDLCQKSKDDNLLIWIGLTRGIPSSGSPRDLDSAVPNMFIYVKPYFGFNKNNSASVCLSKHIRVPDFALNQRYKNFAWNDLTLAQWEANDRGFDTSILLSDQGTVTEGPGFNVFFIKDEKVITPARNCLGGITILALEQLCKELKINFERSDVYPDIVDTTEYAGLASTAGNLIPVHKLENRTFTSHKIFNVLDKHFKEKINDPIWTISY